MITLFALPCLNKCSPRARLAIEKIHYLPAYFMSLTLILAVDVVSLPFAWIQVIKKGCAKKEAKPILFALILFPFVAILICIFDLAMSSYKLWDSSSFNEFYERTKEIRARERISAEDLETLKQVVSRSYKDSNRPVALSTVVKQMREELPFTCTYVDIADIALS